jgi:hypothetical protein
MKNALVYLLAVLTFGSLGYGYYQSTQKSGVTKELEATYQRAIAAEEESQRQANIARQQRAAAEMSAVEARNALQLAQQAVADCQKRKR